MIDLITEYPGTTFLVVYIAGYFLTIMVLGTWGEKWGMNYENTDKDWDDWEDNASAYAGISFAWPMLLLMGSFMLFFFCCKSFAQWTINLNKQNGNRQSKRYRSGIRK